MPLFGALSPGGKRHINKVPYPKCVCVCFCACVFLCVCVPVFGFRGGGLIGVVGHVHIVEPIRPEHARSRQISEAKQGRAWLVLGWETVLGTQLDRSARMLKQKTMHL